MKQDIANTMAKEDSPIRLLFATEAFGMGVDCPDIRHVVNAGPPSTLESKCQVLLLLQTFIERARKVETVQLITLVV